MNKKIKYIIGALICICVVLFGGQDLVNQHALENNISSDAISENTQSLKDINQIKEDDLKIYFIDQTTPNMIQGLKGVFARKPLISRGI